MHTSGSTPSDGSAAITASLPRLASSSSATSASTARVPAAASRSAATTIAATPPFMSAAPRAESRSPSTRGSNGAAIPATPTVSRWPLSTTVRPVRTGGTATRLGRSAGPTTWVAKPAADSRPRRCSTIRASPAAPGTRPGLTLSMPTSSASRESGTCRA